MSAIVPIAEFGYDPPSSKERRKPIDCAISGRSTRSRTPSSPRLTSEAVPRKIPSFGTASAAPKPCERSAARRSSSSARFRVVENQARTCGFQCVGPMSPPSGTAPISRSACASMKPG